MEKVEFKNVEFQSKLGTREELRKRVLENEAFHYQLTGKDSEMLHYEIQNGSKQSAKETLDELNFLMSLFTDKQVPEWYTREDLKKDIKKVQAM